MTEDTICAIATAPGGALGIIRISGPLSISIVDKVFVPAHGKGILERKSSSLVFGSIYTLSGEVLDEAVVSIYRALIAIRERIVWRLPYMGLFISCNRLFNYWFVTVVVQPVRVNIPKERFSMVRWI